MKVRKNGLNKEKLFSLIISLAIILTLGYGIYSVVKNNNSGNNNNIVDLNEGQPGDQAINTKDGPDDLPDPGKLTGADALKETEKETETEPLSVSAEPRINPLAKYSFSTEDTLIKPVEGEIIRKYSVDATVLYKTLNKYETFPAVLIASEVGTNVSAAASGIVQDVIDTEEDGKTVSIALGDNYVMTYGLIDEVNVKKGDTVIKGQLLGKVAQPTKNYLLEGPALYFSLYNGNDPVDPTLFFEGTEE